MWECVYFEGKSCKTQIITETILNKFAATVDKYFYDSEILNMERKKLIYHQIIPNLLEHCVIHVNNVVSKIIRINEPIIRKIHDMVHWSVSDPLAVYHQLPSAGFPPDWLCCHHSGKTCPEK